MSLSENVVVVRIEDAAPAEKHHSRQLDQYGREGQHDDDDDELRGVGRRAALVARTYRLLLRVRKEGSPFAAADARRSVPPRALAIDGTKPSLTRRTS